MSVGTVSRPRRSRLAAHARVERRENVGVICERIAERMDDLGLIPSQLAGACAVAETTAARWYAGSHSPHAEQLVTICRYLDVSPLWLLGVSEEQGEAP